MSDALENLAGALVARFGDTLGRVPSRCGELTFEVPAAQLLDTCRALRAEADWQFEQLVDLAGVDYLDYGRVEWDAQGATSSGFSRGVSPTPAPAGAPAERRFAVVYHLLSVARNRRLRLRTSGQTGAGGTRRCDQLRRPDSSCRRELRFHRHHEREGQ